METFVFHQDAVEIEQHGIPTARATARSRITAHRDIVTRHVIPPAGRHTAPATDAGRHGGRMNWLVKEEPTSYSFDRFVKDGGTRWSGVRNPLAQKHLRSIHKGDRILYYHTGSEKAVVGMARAAGDPSPDPSDPAGRRVTVDLVPLQRLPRPVPLATIRRLKAIADPP